MQRSMPVSNMTRIQLRDLINGRYQILQSDVNSATWSIIYHGENGRTHFCIRHKDGVDELALERHIVKTATGPAGIYYDSIGLAELAPALSRERATSVIYNPDTGEFTEYRWVSGKWRPLTGWLQDQFPDVAREFCRKIPRSSDVNFRQEGDDIRSMIKGARPIKGGKIAFRNTNKSPLTAEMLYWLYSPVEFFQSIRK